MADAASTVTYLLEMDDGDQKRITIPDDWTVTFGALIPGQQTNSGRLGLRFWKGKQQKALFQGVKSFRDMSIVIEERRTTTKEETYYKGNEENRKAVVVQQQAHEWVNPDAPPAAKVDQPLLSQAKVVALD